MMSSERPKPKRLAPDTGAPQEGSGENDLSGNFRERFLSTLGEGYSGSGGDNGPPKKPKKELHWNDNIEIDPSDSPVKVEMDYSKWADLLKDGQDDWPRKVPLGSILVDVEGEVIDLAPYLECLNGAYFRFCIPHRLFSYSSIFSGPSTEAFLSRFDSVSKQQLRKEGLEKFLQPADFPSFRIGLGFDVKDDKDAIVSQLKLAARSIAIIIEVFLKMLNDERPVSLDVPDPQSKRKIPAGSAPSVATG